MNRVRLKGNDLAFVLYIDVSLEFNATALFQYTAFVMIIRKVNMNVGTDSANNNTAALRSCKSKQALFKFMENKLERSIK